MLISGVALFIIGFIPLNNLNVITVLALIAKFSISFPFNGMMIITSEVYPTGISHIYITKKYSFYFNFI